MTRATPLLVAACISFGATGCSWIQVPGTVPPERPARCSDRVIPKRDIGVSIATGLVSLATGTASAYHFFSPEYRHDDTGTGIAYGSITALVAGLLAVPSLLYGLSARYGYINISTCEQQLAAPAE